MVKLMDLDRHPKKDLIINEILVMRTSRHPNIVRYIDSFLSKKELWVITEHMEGGNLTDVVTANLMSEGQIAAVSREMCQGLDYLHRRGVIHSGIKSDNVLLSLHGDIKLSTSHPSPIPAHFAWPYCSVSQIVDLVSFSRLWIPCANFREQRQAYDHDWNPLLDGSRGYNGEGVRAQCRHLVFGNCGNR